MRKSHAPYGSSFTFCGASSSAALTATISPESGAGMSEAALTDSTTAHSSPRFTLRPAAGCCTNTTSPSSSCAKSVMPTVTVPSASARTHWWLAVYLSSSGVFMRSVSGRRRGQQVEPESGRVQVAGIEVQTYRDLRVGRYPAAGIPAGVQVFARLENTSCQGVLTRVGEDEIERGIPKVVSGMVAQRRGQLDHVGPRRVVHLEIGRLDGDLSRSLRRRHLATQRITHLHEQRLQHGILHGKIGPVKMRGLTGEREGQQHRAHRPPSRTARRGLAEQFVVERELLGCRSVFRGIGS